MCAQGPGEAWLFDIVRGSVICETVEEVNALLTCLLRQDAATRRQSQRQRQGQGQGRGQQTTTTSTAPAAMATPRTDDATASPRSDDAVVAPELEVLRLKNRFKFPTPGGFRDVNVNIRIRIDDGDGTAAGAAAEPVYHVCELQIHCHDIKDLAKKLLSHKVLEF